MFNDTCLYLALPTHAFALLFAKDIFNRSVVSQPRKHSLQSYVSRPMAVDAVDFISPDNEQEEFSLPGQIENASNANRQQCSSLHENTRLTTEGVRDRDGLAPHSRYVGYCRWSRPRTGKSIDPSQLESVAARLDAAAASRLTEKVFLELPDAGRGPSVGRARVTCSTCICADHGANRSGTDWTNHLQPKMRFGQEFRMACVSL